MRSFWARAAERPALGLAGLALLQVAAWSLAPALSHSALPLDVVEMYGWGREWVVATFKHPNLPGLVLEAVRQVTGVAGWPAYVVSQFFVVSTYGAIYLLGRDLMDARRALAGVLLLTGVYFFTWPTPEFNHNVAQMPFWALTALLLWRATTRNKAIYWALLGVVAGLSLWAKYSSAVLLAVAAVWMVWDAAARRSWVTPGPWITAVTFALSAAPQAIWLVQHEFQPFAYAARRASDGAWWAPLEFLLTLALDHLPMLLLIAVAGMLGPRNAEASEQPSQRAWRFLLLMGLGPALLTALAAALSGASLRASWGAPMTVFSGLLAVAALSSRLSAERLRRLMAGASVLIVVVAGLYFAHMAYGVRWTQKPLRGNWPQAEISAALHDRWRAETGEPLRIVAGDIWTAGLIGLERRDPPSVLINGDYTISPWLQPEDLARDGALIVWSGSQPAALGPFVGDLPVRTLEFHPAQAPNSRPIVVFYAIRPPSRP